MPSKARSGPRCATRYPRNYSPDQDVFADGAGALTLSGAESRSTCNCASLMMIDVECADRDQRLRLNLRPCYESRRYISDKFHPCVFNYKTGRWL